MKQNRIWAVMFAVFLGTGGQLLAQTRWAPNSSGNRGDRGYNDSSRGDWVTYRQRGCIGRSICANNGWTLQVPLDGGTVDRIRFTARHPMGKFSAGRLTVRVGGGVIESRIKISSKREKRFDLRAGGVRADTLVFEAVDGDVEIDEIEVLYSNRGGSDDGGSGGDYEHGSGGGGNYWNPNPGGDWAPIGPPADGGGGGGNYGNSRGWVSYRDRDGCYGRGNRCRDRGDTLSVRLENRPVYRLRFQAHDDLGSRTEAQMEVRIDGKMIQRMDVKKRGRRYDIPLNGIYGNRLEIRVYEDDAMIRDLEVLYDRR